VHNPASENAIDVIIEDDGWRKLISDLETLSDQCRHAAATAAPVSARRLLDANAALLFTNDDALRQLNQRFRGVDKPTNVLSFPATGPTAATPGFLGDIAIARETCVREAAEAGIGLRAHTAHLIVHGLLHLIGYDHETDDDAAVMEPLETKVLLALGFSDPHAPD
jgi:probable rRNA maturation factor